MNMLDIIAKKRDGQTLSNAEIKWFIDEYTHDNIPDYQAAALLMAIYINGMDRSETVALTLAMAYSGDVIDLSDVVDIAIDKHSSGGVGDKTSLVVIPLVAACGVSVAKMSGRGLGHTGGTLDKLESISGMQVEFNEKDFKRITGEHQIILAGQSAEIAPADKKIYALRDVTATVSSLPLIASSIMSKKLAAGADAIVLDVKVGKGAFMATPEAGSELAKLMIEIGVDAGKKMVALISDMNQPLGMAAGLALEVREAIETLQDKGPSDFREHCLVAATHMLHLAERGDLRDCRAMAELALTDGSALAKFREMVAAQGGDPNQIDDPNLLPTAKLQEPITNELDDGFYVAEVNALAVGRAVVDLGGGRNRKEDPIDHAVGVITHVRVGDRVKKGDVLFTLHGNDPAKLEAARERLKEGILFSDTPCARLPIFYDTLTGQPKQE